MYAFTNVDDSSMQLSGINVIFLSQQGHMRVTLLMSFLMSPIIILNVNNENDLITDIITGSLLSILRFSAWTGIILSKYNHTIYFGHDFGQYIYMLEYSVNESIISVHDFISDVEN